MTLVGLVYFKSFCICSGHRYFVITNFDGGCNNDQQLACSLQVSSLQTCLLFQITSSPVSLLWLALSTPAGIVLPHFFFFSLLFPEKTAFHRALAPPPSISSSLEGTASLRPFSCMSRDPPAPCRGWKRRQGGRPWAPLRLVTLSDPISSSSSSSGSVSLPRRRCFFWGSFPVGCQAACFWASLSLTMAGVKCGQGAGSLSSLGVVMKEAVEGVLMGEGVSGGGVEVELCSSVVLQCLISLPAAEEELWEMRKNSSSDGGTRGVQRSDLNFSTKENKKHSIC